MISVLHIYPEKAPLIARYVNQLMEAIGQRASMQATCNMAEFRQMCKQQNPNIIHLHGGVSMPTVAPSRLVVTPHGAPLSTMHPYAIIARSAMEAQRCGETGGNRVQIIRNPLVTKTVSWAETATAVLQVYQRVMDTDVLPLMDDVTRQMLRLLLKAGICGDRRWIEGAIPATEAVNFHQLYIYATHEGVLPVVEHGLHVLMVEAPPCPETHSYLPESYRRPVDMTGNDLVKMVEDVAKNGPTLLRLVNIHQALRQEKLDEEQLLNKLKEKNLNPLFNSLLQIAQEETLLNAGFMPCPPVDNQLTRRLRTQLTNHLKI